MYIIQGAQTRFGDWKREIERAKTLSELEGRCTDAERETVTDWLTGVGR